MPDILMPKLSDSMTEGKLLRWNVAEGQRVLAGDVIAEVETDKANMEIETLEAGIITGFRAFAGDTVPVGAVMATLMVEGEVPEPPDHKPVDLASSEAPARPPSINASPLAINIAEERGVDLAEVRGTGRGGKITKEDVLAHIASRKPAAASAPPVDEPPADDVSDNLPDELEEFLEIIEQTSPDDVVQVIEMESLNGGGRKGGATEEDESDELLMADRTEFDDEDDLLVVDGIDFDDDEDDMEAPPAVAPIHVACDVDMTAVMATLPLMLGEVARAVARRLPEAQALALIGPASGIGAMAETCLLNAVVTCAAARALAELPLQRGMPGGASDTIAVGLAVGDDLFWLPVDDAPAQGLLDVLDWIVAHVPLGEEDFDDVPEDAGMDLAPDDGDEEPYDDALWEFEDDGEDPHEQLISECLEMPQAALALLNLGPLGVDEFSGLLEDGSVPVLSLGTVRTTHPSQQEGAGARRVMRLGLSVRADEAGPIAAARLVGRVREILENPLLLAGMRR